MTVEAVNVKSGERKVYHAQYAVGCDGGKSFVRKSLGINTFCSTILLTHATFFCNFCSRFNENENC